MNTCAKLRIRPRSRLCRVNRSADRLGPRPTLDSDCMNSLNADRWTEHDLPVLRVIVAIYDENPGEFISPESIARRLETPDQQVRASLVRLCHASPPYIKASVDHGYEEPMTVVEVHHPTERALREVGTWPTPETALDRLVAALERQAEQASSEEERSKARTVLAAIGAAGRDLMVNAVGGIVAGATLAG
jgi:hypothetical protein